METLTEILQTKPISLFDINIINPLDFSQLVIRFFFNLVVTFLVVNYIYARNSKRKDFYFSYFAISITIFLLCFLLESVKLELGFALGLFAIFGIIRYRTDPIPIKEMTYLFVVIGIAVINALTSNKISYAELFFTNLVIVASMFILEKVLKLKQEMMLHISYENIEYIHILKKEELYKDIQKRTGIEVKRIEIQKINYLRDIAWINVYYDPNDSTGKSNTF